MKIQYLTILLLCLAFIRPAQGEVLCWLCHSLYNLLWSFANSKFCIFLFANRNVDHMIVKENYMAKNCGGFSKEICEEFFEHNDFASEKNRLLRFNGTILCPKLGLCSNPKIVKEDFEEYKRKILADKPPREYPPPTNFTKPLQFLVFTDVHNDPNYTTTRSTKCQSSICCRNDSPLVHNDSDRPGKWGVVGQCDLPFITAEHFINQTYEKHSNALFLLWLGDNIANAYYAMNPIDHRHIIQNLTNKLLVHHNRIGDVYPVVGNHEGLPRDHMKWEPDGSNWLLDMVSEIWKPWLTQESYETMKKCGHYSQLHPGTKLRIVALNSFVRGSTNSYLWDNTTDVCGELVWLEKTLNKAEQNGEKALIISHFPSWNGFGTIRIFNIIS